MVLGVMGGGRRRGFGFLDGGGRGRGGQNTGQAVLGF